MTNECYEYAITPNSLSGSDLVRRLNELGAQGWVVCARSRHDGVILVRKIETNDPRRLRIRKLRPASDPHRGRGFYGVCRRCGTSWRRKRYHQTSTSSGNACFALCEHCWGALTPAERLPYYRVLVDEWNRRSNSEDRWPDIRRAVLDGR